MTTKQPKNKIQEIFIFGGNQKALHKMGATDHLVQMAYRFGVFRP